MQGRAATACIGYVTRHTSRDPRPVVDGGTGSSGDGGGGGGGAVVVVVVAVIVAVTMVYQKAQDVRVLHPAKQQKERQTGPSDRKEISRPDQRGK